MQHTGNEWSHFITVCDFLGRQTTICRQSWIGPEHNEQTDHFNVVIFNSIMDRSKDNMSTFSTTYICLLSIQKFTVNWIQSALNLVLATWCHLVMRSWHWHHVIATNARFPGSRWRSTRAGACSLRYPWCWRQHPLTEGSKRQHPAITVYHQWLQI